ncbi:hypothetical protein U472_14355 [Orenia metallireducens]|jgi:hypothetical protein|uniref:Uncharacterized protein n=1 Tax=Orenia metallireducens TaxID=1413210 RepID=A0A1C0A5Y2_9FIRM|nr:hypothetical protein [Orenia metallireducens]OCL25519.1 hypothetical protein U472_14355 [Orenia metallireducens]
MSENTTIIVKQEKSVGLSLLLTFLFGGLGLMYTSIGWGIFWFLVDAVAAIFTFGISAIFIHPIIMIIGAVMTNNYNKRLNNTYKS